MATDRIWTAAQALALLAGAGAAGPLWAQTLQQPLQLPQSPTYQAPSPQVSAQPPDQQPPGQAQGGVQPITPAPLPPAGQGQLQPLTPILPPPIMQGDTTGEGGARAILQWTRNRLASMGATSTTAPPGWHRTHATGVPIVAVNHPKEWVATLHAQPSPYGSGAASVQGRIMSQDGLHLIEGASNSFAPRVPPEQVLQGPMSAYLAQLGEERELNRETFSTPVMGGMMTAETFFRAVEGRNYTIVGVATTIVDPGLDQGAAMAGMAPVGPWAYKIVIGPKASFTEMAQKLYVPILNSASF